LYTDPYAEVFIEEAIARGWELPQRHMAERIRSISGCAASRTKWFDEFFIAAGAAIRLRGNVDVGMLLLTGIFTVITAPVVANRVGQLAYREQNLHDTLTRDELNEYTQGGTNGQN